jgi:hypothetical protein
MAIQILTRPQYQLSSGIASRWTSASHPIEYSGLSQPVDESARPNYQLVFYLREAGSAVLIARSSRKPFRDGSWRFNVAPYVRKYFTFQDGTEKKTGAVNERDTGKSLEFYLEYQEVDDISGEGVINTDSQSYFAVNSAVQIPRKRYGQNMADYVPGVENQMQGKFLSVLDKPKKWEGYPFSLSFIYDPNLNAIEVNKLETRRDVNNAYINEFFYGLDNNHIGAVNHLYLADSLPANTRFIDVSLHSGQIIPNTPGYVAKGYVQEGYVETPIAEL